MQHNQHKEVGTCPALHLPSRYIEAPGPGGPTLSTFSLSTCSSDLLHPQPPEPWAALAAPEAAAPAAVCPSAAVCQPAPAPAAAKGGVARVAAPSPAAVSPCAASARSDSSTHTPVCIRCPGWRSALDLRALSPSPACCWGRGGVCSRKSRHSKPWRGPDP